MAVTDSFLSPQLGASAAPGATSSPGAVRDIGAGFDVPNSALISTSALTSQAQVFSAHEAVSKYPAYTPRVKVDLLASPLIPDGDAMRSFVYGLEKDLDEADRRALAAAQSQIEIARTLPATPTSGLSDNFEARAADNIGNDFRRLIHDVAGGNLFNSPSVIGGDPNTPVIDMKMRAIRRGLLPPDTKLDGRWTPAHNNAYFDVKGEELGEYLQGERTGAVSTGGFLNFVDNWLAPSSLLSTTFSTLTSDLIPNIGEIKSEARGWWGKIKDWVDEPTDWKRFVGALGPIDDIVFPLMNTALLASGVGGVASFARVGLAARAAGIGTAAGLRTATPLAVRGIQAGRFGTSGIQAASTLARASQPGLIAGRLAKGSSGVAKGTSRAMEAWRASFAAQTARKTVGEGMKIGIAGQLEAEISPDRKVGLVPWGTLEQTHARRIEQMKRWRTGNPLVGGMAAVAEIPFTPVFIFKQGRIAEPIKKAWSNLPEALAKAPVFNYSGPRANTQFRTNQFGELTGTAPAADSSLRLTAETDKMMSGIVASGAQPRHVKQRVWAKLDQPLDRIAYYMTGADVRKLSDADAQTAYETTQEIFLSGVIDKALDDVALASAKTVSKGGNVDGDLIMRIRAGKEATLRDLGHLGEPDLEDWNQMQAFSSHLIGRGVIDSDDVVGVKQLRASSVDKAIRNLQSNPEEFGKQWADFVEHHQGLRTGLLNDLLDGVDQNTIQAMLIEQGDSFTNWQSYQQTVRDLQLWAPQGGVNTMGVEVSGTGIPLHALMGEELFKYIPELASAEIKGSALDRVGQLLEGGRWAITAGGRRTATVQQAEHLSQALDQMLDARRQLQALDDAAALGLEAPAEFGVMAQSLEDWAAALPSGTSVEDLSTESLAAWAVAQRPTGTQINQIELQTTEVGKGIQWLKRNGYSVDTGLDDLTRKLDELNSADFWERFEISHRMGVGTGREFGTNHWKQTVRGLEPRPTTIEDKAALLKAKKGRFAVEVDVPTSDPRYRAVVGKNFLQSHDISNTLNPLVDIHDAHIRRYSLGQYTRRQTLDMHKSQEQNFLQILSGRLREMSEWDADAQKFRVNPGFGGWDNMNIDPNSTDMDNLTKTLKSVHGAILDNLHETIDVETGLSEVLLRASSNTLGFNYLGMNPSTMHQLLEEAGLTGKVADAIVGAAVGSRNLGWEFQGFASTGTRLVREGWLRQFSGGLKYSEAGNELGNAAKAARVVGLGSHSHQMDIYRHWKAAGSAIAVGTFQGISGALEGEDFTGTLGRAATGAAVGGALGAGVGRLEGKGSVGRNLMRVAAFDFVGGTDSPEDLLRGAAAATFGMAAIRTGSTVGHNMMKGTGWGQYSRMGERFERMRNQIRFSLSPVFDMQRRTEGVVLAGATTFTDDAGNISQLPMSLRPRTAAAQKLKKMKWRDLTPDMPDDQAARLIRGYFQDATKGVPWAEGVNMMNSRITDIGMTGFSPLDAMAGTYAQVMAHNPNFDPTEAVSLAKRVYTYGTTSRSGLEQSVNFVFFPFSFQKQYLGRLGDFFSNDMGRLMMVHAGLKNLELAEGETGFGDWVGESLPGIRQFRKMNNFAYGFSPGQFGGINRPYVDVLRRIGGVSEGVDAVTNLFLPQGLAVDSQADADEWWRNMERVLPIVRDGNDLVEDMQEAYYVARSPSHKLKKIDEQAGWEKYGALKDEFSETALQMGVSYSTLRSNPSFLGFQQEFQKRVRDIEDSHPAWVDNRAENVKNRTMKANELTRMRLAPEGAKELAVQTFDEETRKVLAIYGGDLEDLPGLAQSQLRRKAQLLAVEEPSFRRQYERFFMRDLGPIDVRL